MSLHFIRITTCLLIYFIDRTLCYIILLQYFIALYFIYPTHILLRCIISFYFYGTCNVLLPEIFFDFWSKYENSMSRERLFYFTITFYE